MLSRFKNIFKSQKPIALGRWGDHNDETKKNIKSLWNASDHCGDRICGDPKKVKLIINREKRIKK
jgi:hypothetical protein